MLEWLESLGLLGLFLGTFLAATVLPFSSDALYLFILAASDNPLACFVVGTAGNWLGGVTTYWIGYAGRLEWIEKLFKVKPEALERQRARIDRYGVWLAALSWVPVAGDILALGLGYFKVRPLWCMVLLLLGKAARFYVWNLAMQLF